MSFQDITQSCDQLCLFFTNISIKKNATTTLKICSLPSARIEMAQYGTVQNRTDNNVGRQLYKIHTNILCKHIVQPNVIDSIHR